MKVIIFFQEPDFEVDDYEKHGYVKLEGGFTSEEDIIRAFMNRFRMDTEFWYKLKLIPIEVTPEMRVCLQLYNDQWFAYIVDRSNKTSNIKTTTYRLKEMKKLKEYVTKDGEVIPIPDNIEAIPMNEQTVLVKIKNSSMEDAIEFVQELKKLTNLNLFYVSDNVEFMVVEEVEDTGFVYTD